MNQELNFHGMQIIPMSNSELLEVDGGLFSTTDAYNAGVTVGTYIGKAAAGASVVLTFMALLL